VPETSLPFLTRLWFAWACFFRVLFDGAFAARVLTMGPQAAPNPGAQARVLTMGPQAAPNPGAQVRVLTMGPQAAPNPGAQVRAFQAREPAALPPAPAPAPTPEEPPKAKQPAKTPEIQAAATTTPAVPEPPSPGPALQLLALLQREGRLIDFLEQDIEPFGDAEIGAAVRVVHAGCRKALRGHAKISPVRSEEEGTSVTLPEGFNPSEVKLSGNVKGSAPYKGVLRHRGWRAADLVLPTPVGGHDPRIIAPAEVEL
jgi:hypothetical protein